MIILKPRLMDADRHDLKMVDYVDIASESSDDEPSAKRSKELEGVRRSARLSSKPAKRYSNWDSDMSESLCYVDTSPEPWANLECNEDIHKDPIDLPSEPEEEEEPYEVNTVNNNSDKPADQKEEQTEQNARVDATEENNGTGGQCRSGPCQCPSAPRGFGRSSPLRPEYPTRSQLLLHLQAKH